MLVAVMHFIPDDDDPYGIVARFLNSLAPGSYLVMSHATGEYLDARTLAGFSASPAAPSFRTREQFSRFFEGLVLVPPGIVSAAEWRAEDEPQPRPTAADTATHCAVARLP
jgi:S-adenosyl methyltransferase